MMSIDSGIGGDEDSDRAAWDAIFRTQVGRSTAFKGFAFALCGQQPSERAMDETDAAQRQRSAVR